MKRLAIPVLLALLSVPALAAEGAAPPFPAWLVGGWEMQNGADWADEYWTPPRGGVMIGAGRTGTGAGPAFWEHTRIARRADGSLSFFAQPKGVPATEFPLVASGPGMVEFANAAHDYPQRIRYWRECKVLRARISLIDGSQPVEYRFVPQSGRARR